MALQFATRLSLLAFSAMLLDGLLCGADFRGAISGAFAAAGVCLCVGYACGEMAKRIVQEMAAKDVERMTARQIAPPSDR